MKTQNTVKLPNSVDTEGTSNLKKSGDTVSDNFAKSYEDLYGSSKKKDCFRKDWLPDPLEYYRRHLHKLRIHGDWGSTICPFHKDKVASLSVNIKDGGFFCHGCGAKGGDIVDFHQKLFNFNFPSAAKDLEAWDFDG